MKFTACHHQRPWVGSNVVNQTAQNILIVR
ncbi:hypothetical protein BAL199_29400 [alpha proteobacterium BAL199]|nr:hypothetical protein BAL199_29400 [alpha proteobacterium BAL199]